MRAENQAGISPDSEILGLVFATVPEQPPQPVLLSSETNEITIGVDSYDQATSSVSNGGCDILSFDY